MRNAYSRPAPNTRSPAAGRRRETAHAVAHASRRTRRGGERAPVDVNTTLALSSRHSGCTPARMPCGARGGVSTAARRETRRAPRRGRTSCTAGPAPWRPAVASTLAAVVAASSARVTGACAARSTRQQRSAKSAARGRAPKPATPQLMARARRCCGWPRWKEGGEGQSGTRPVPEQATRRNDGPCGNGRCAPSLGACQVAKSAWFALMLRATKSVFCCDQSSSCKK